MPRKVMPLIHVPDVRTAVEWYQSIGFTVLGVNEAEGLMDWAMLSFGEGTIMFSEGGQPSTAYRREVDLYVQTEGIDDLYQQLRGRVEVVEGPHDTFYGTREIIIRDLNRFWITFSEEIEKTE
jgi:uncharacterized glyoxalase superfamily protein PhnB